MVQQTERPSEQRPRVPRPFRGNVRSSQQSAWGQHPGLPVRRASGLQWAPSDPAVLCGSSSRV